MLQFERHSFIMDELEKGIVYIKHLAEVLDVSEITIRRDLKTLEKDGKVVMLHGGAAKKIDTSRETATSQRQRLFTQEKEAIGQLAADLVEDGDVIFIDSGTTNITMIKYLMNRKVTIVTNGLKTTEEAVKYNLPITTLGGELKVETMSFIGSITSRVLNMYTFDKCFLGANGIDKEFGFSNADPSEAFIKEQAIQRSKKAYILADHSKFNVASVFKFAEIDDATIITDSVSENFIDLDIPIITKP
ncbi:DeoR/GlpR family DNA-binding transcription regulator [Fundicoccus culcitae]|uniref:DeoR/GlpR family DNA-binding transcription regulator n=1 Tax=Fundicoccus culcitae TaxID=2969821 RepID=A0ABY5P4K3_9LACT|nr:DeoR/GlpR family DNA-binding transcription regulator [Fundicoccus culcitae]UUX33363.1 DeoR/GlpR family DNA-binding transcription regulator [Fundicoccus culcitae]